jgi:hypothetical protein
MKHILFDEISEGFEVLIKYRAGKANHPECLQAVDAALVQRLRSLVGHIEVDLDAALLPEDE